MFGHVLPTDIRYFLFPHSSGLFHLIALQLFLASLVIVAVLGIAAEIDVQIEGGSGYYSRIALVIDVCFFASCWEVRLFGEEFGRVWGLNIKVRTDVFVGERKIMVAGEKGT